MNTRETLLAARALLDTPDKWGKGTADFGVTGDPQDGKVCVGIALQIAAGGYPLPRTDECQSRFEPAREAMARAIGAAWFSEWNDDPERTHADVLAAFDRAIEAVS